MARQDINVYKNLKDVPDSVKEALLRLRQDFESHIHDGSSGRAFQSLVAEALTTRSLQMGVLGNIYIDESGIQKARIVFRDLVDPNFPPRERYQIYGEENNGNLVIVPASDGNGGIRIGTLTLKPISVYLYAKDEVVMYAKSGANEAYILVTPTQITITDNTDIQALLQCDSFRIDQVPAAGAITPTHTITINVNGTNYKIPIVAE